LYTSAATCVADTVDCGAGDAIASCGDGNSLAGFCKERAQNEEL
jgi:hypothetical protein